MEYKETPLDAIKEFCKKCIGGARYVDRCTGTNCDIYPYRKGKNPFRKKRKLTDEQREQLAERLKNARNNKIESKFKTEW